MISAPRPLRTDSCLSLSVCSACLHRAIVIVVSACKSPVSLELPSQGWYPLRHLHLASAFHARLQASNTGAITAAAAAAPDSLDQRRTHHALVLSVVVVIDVFLYVPSRQLSPSIELRH